MSQAGDFQKNDTFNTDNGTATSSNKTVSILGGVNVQTSGSGSTVTIKALQETTAKTATYTATADDYFINCTANSFTINLPDATSLSGKIYNVKNSGTGTITVDAYEAQTIDGQTTQDLFQDESITIITDGSNWYIV